MTAPRAIAAVYDIAKGVYQGSIGRSEGARRIHQKFGVNVNSVYDLIDGYRCLSRGEVFHRTLSARDMRFYLSRILADGGTDALRTALHALWLHISYYEGIQGAKLRTMRTLAAEFQLSAGNPPQADQLTAEFERAVRRSLSDTSARRRKRLQRAGKIPRRVVGVVVGFARNADVVVEVLLRARGRCEGCRRKAPFLRQKDRKPYLEVHHVRLLADGGEDTVKNAVALCPNCHRERHFGVSLAG